MFRCVCASVCCQVGPSALQTACHLPITPGPCKAYIPSWAHNSVTHECEEFIYGGCGGNKNRFASEEQCEQACTHEEQDPVDPDPDLPNPQEPGHEEGLVAGSPQSPPQEPSPAGDLDVLAVGGECSTRLSHTVVENGKEPL